MPVLLWLEISRRATQLDAGIRRQKTSVDFSVLDSQVLVPHITFCRPHHHTLGASASLTPPRPTSKVVLIAAAQDQFDLVGACLLLTLAKDTRPTFSFQFPGSSLASSTWAPTVFRRK